MCSSRLKDINIRALVLGGCGFIGSNLVNELISHNNYVRVFDKECGLNNRRKGVSDYVYGDFKDRQLLSSALSNIDIVYHCISTTSPKTSNENIEFDIRTNILDTLYLLDRCVDYKISKIVFISSGGAIYGNPSKLPVSEEDQCLPLSSYGITKLTIEKYLHLYNHLYGLEYSIIRPSNPYGPGQSLLTKGAVNSFIESTLKIGSVEVWGDGEIIRDYIYIKDLVECIYRISLERSNNRIFNVGSGEGVSLNSLVDTVDKCLDTKTFIQYKSGRDFDVKEVYLDISRVVRDFDWRPKIKLEDGINLTKLFYLK
jgi:UDP-glucose 4-epimerase